MAKILRVRKEPQGFVPHNPNPPALTRDYTKISLWQRRKSSGCERETSVERYRRLPNTQGGREGVEGGEEKMSEGEREIGDLSSRRASPQGSGKARGVETPLLRK